MCMDSPYTFNLPHIVILLQTSQMSNFVSQISDKESSITLSMYLGVKWEDSRITNMNLTMEDLQGVRFPFLSYLWQPDIEIHHVRNIKEMKVMGQFMAGLQINRGARREVLFSQVKCQIIFHHIIILLSLVSLSI